MSDSPYLEITLALSTHLKAGVDAYNAESPSTLWDFAGDGLTYDPQPDRNYVVFNEIGQVQTPLDLGPNRRHTLTDIFQVSFMLSEKSKGLGDLMRAMDFVGRHFYPKSHRSFPLTQGATTLRIDTFPTASGYIREIGRFRRDLDIAYTAYLLPVK